MQTLMGINGNTAPRQNKSYQYKPHEAQPDSQQLWVQLMNLTTESHTCRPHTALECGTKAWYYLAPLLESGRFEAGQPFVSSICKHTHTVHRVL